MYTNTRSYRMCTNFKLKRYQRVSYDTVYTTYIKNRNEPTVVSTNGRSDLIQILTWKYLKQHPPYLLAESTKNLQFFLQQTHDKPKLLKASKTTEHS
jgi:hypothetical protein